MSVRISKCYKQYLTTQDPQHCHISEHCKGWGGKYISSISADNTYSAFKYWYEFGHFADNNYNKWIIDKQELSTALKKDVQSLGLSQCPKFDSKDVVATLDLLPSEIVIDNIHWTLMEDISTREIIGISHFEELPPATELKDLMSGVDWDRVFPANTPNNTPKDKPVSNNLFDNQNVSKIANTPALGTYFYLLWFVLFIIRALRRI
nr:MAG TPA: hypothetical protein [Bacteriophage sp.]